MDTKIIKEFFTNIQEDIKIINETPRKEKGDNRALNERIASVACRLIGLTLAVAATFSFVTAMVTLGAPAVGFIITSIFLLALNLVVAHDLIKVGINLRPKSEDDDLNTVADAALNAAEALKEGAKKASNKIKSAGRSVMHAVSNAFNDKPAEPRVAVPAISTKAPSDPYAARMLKGTIIAGPAYRLGSSAYEAFSN